MTVRRGKIIGKHKGLVRMQSLIYPLVGPHCLYLGRGGKYNSHGTGSGFTLIEIIIAVVIISIAAVMVIPLLSSAASMQIRSAANMIAADLEYAKSIAISKGQNFSVVFDTTTDSYRIEDQLGNVIPHPVKKGFDYVIDFRNDSRLDKVDIANVDFDATSKIKFDYMGSPYNGNNNPLNSGVISLQAAGITTTVNVEPVTGFVSIED